MLCARSASDDGEPAGGGASLTAVLLTFLNVSLVARGKAEGNRGRGLTATWIDRLEGGAAVEGDGAAGVIDFGRPSLGGDTSLSRRGTTIDAAECAVSRLVSCLDGRSVAAVNNGEQSRGNPSTASTVRKKSRRAARHSFSWVDSEAQSPASVGTPRALQNMLFLHCLGPLEKTCIVRSLRENRILIVTAGSAEMVVVVNRELVLTSRSARGSFAMRVHTNVSSYITNW